MNPPNCECGGRGVGHAVADEKLRFIFSVQVMNLMPIQLMASSCVHQVSGGGPRNVAHLSLACQVTVVWAENVIALETDQMWLDVGVTSVNDGAHLLHGKKPAKQNFVPITPKCGGTSDGDKGISTYAEQRIRTVVIILLVTLALALPQFMIVVSGRWCGSERPLSTFDVGAHTLPLCDGGLSTAQSTQSGCFLFVGILAMQYASVTGNANFWSTTLLDCLVLTHGLEASSSASPFQNGVDLVFFF